MAGAKGMVQGRILFDEELSPGFIKYKEKKLTDRLPVHLIIISYGIGLILITVTNPFLLKSGLGLLIVFLIVFVAFLLIRRDYLKLKGVIVYDNSIVTPDDDFIPFNKIRKIYLNVLMKRVEDNEVKFVKVIVIGLKTNRIIYIDRKPSLRIKKFKDSLPGELWVIKEPYNMIISKDKFEHSILLVLMEKGVELEEPIVEFKEPKRDLGKMIYKDFTYNSNDKESIFGVETSLIALFLSGGLLLLFFGIILLLTFNIVEGIIFLILGLIILLSASSIIKNDLVDYHEYILYEKGILRPGYWHQDDEFIPFRGIESVTFNKRWLKSRLNVVMFLPKARGTEEFREFQKYRGLIINRSQFKDIEKFKENIFPLLEKYKIKVIEKT